jgi:putative ABC transport system permease protein
MSTGFMRTIDNTGRADRVIVLSQGSLFEFASSISRANALTIADAPGIKKTGDGKPIASADALAFVAVTKKSDGLDAFIALRGVGPEGLALLPEIKLIGGRMFSAGAQFREQWQRA